MNNEPSKVKQLEEVKVISQIKINHNWRVQKRCFIVWNLLLQAASGREEDLKKNQHF